jgi:para-nitrobenzyl esterase
MKSGAIVLAIVAILALATTATAAPVRVDGGRVEGTVQDGIRTWLGIPYAAPPVGDLRWRAPQPVVPWSGVRQATAFSKACRQTATWITFPESEDCLYLNVWAPPVAKHKKPLPVMVWIYGGGYYGGTAEQPLYNGVHIARHGVILVTLNYRLGVFGFFSHPELAAEGKADGNQGVLDQVAALRWVRKNISAFGGDPHRVTIFGESAGSASVSVLEISPLAKGLFQRAIAESGTTAIDPRETGRLDKSAADARGVALGQALNAPHLADLRKLDTETVIAQPWSPHLVADDYLIRSDMTTAYQAGEPSRVPLLLGWNADEGKDLAGEALGHETLTVERYPALAAGLIGHTPSQALLDAYPVTRDAEVKPMLFKLMNDAWSWHMYTWAKLHTASHSGPVYVYDFVHIPAAPKTPCGYGCGAGHGAEIPYVYDQLAQDPRTWSADDHMVAERMVTAKTGNPNGPGLPAWPVFDGSDPSVIRLGSDAEVKSAPPLPDYKLIGGH